MAPEAVHHHQSLSPPQRDTTRGKLQLSPMMTVTASPPPPPAAHSESLGLPVADKSPPDALASGVVMVPPSPPLFLPMLRHLRACLWAAVHRVLRHVWAAKELFGQTARFWLFLCSGERAAASAGMKGDGKKGREGRRGEEGRPPRPEEEGSRSMAVMETQVEREELKRRMSMEEEEEEGWEQEWSDEDDDEEEEDSDGNQLEEEGEEDEEYEESDWVEWESEDEEDDEEDDVNQHSCPKASHSAVTVTQSATQPHDEVDMANESGKEDDDDDVNVNNDNGSDWSDDEYDDNDDSESSAESVELWESFLHSDDPYNPLCFSSYTHTSPSKNAENTHTSPSKNAENTHTSLSKSTHTSPSKNTENTHTSPSKNSENTHTSPAKVVESTHTSSLPAERARAEQQEEEDEQHSSRPLRQHKTVRFSDELVSVRPLVAWSFASRAARDGSCWMQMARDRLRFRRRVEDAGRVISPCLCPQHRRLVWERLQNPAL